jgi:short-subunit dehydrogenase
MKILVTGATSGIGRQLALDYQESGHAVTAVGRSADALDALAITLAPENIRVSLVCPGFVKTPLTDKNDFSMPFLMDVQSTSNAIRKGIEKKQAEIHFPKKLTWGMKAAARLPRSLWAALARRMIKS